MTVTVPVWLVTVAPARAHLVAAATAQQAKWLVLGEEAEVRPGRFPPSVKVRAATARDWEIFETLEALDPALVSDDPPPLSGTEPALF